MLVADIMSRDPSVANSDEDVTAVAKRMADDDLGFLPVVSGGNLVGAVTDRDIVIRYVAKGSSTGTVQDVMTSDVRSCASQDDADTVIKQMGDWQLRRLPVVDDGKLVGIVSLADAARERDPSSAGSALGEVTQPGQNG